MSITYQQDQNQETVLNSNTLNEPYEKAKLADKSGSSLPAASEYQPLERELSLDEIKDIASRISPERTRAKLVAWGLGTFSFTVLFSGLLMGMVALSPSVSDYQPIKDWMHAVITVEVGILGAACGYYLSD